MINDADLWDINEKRKRKGLPPLTREEARRSIERDNVVKSGDHTHEDYHGGFGHFLIGLTTGFPMGSPMGLAGAAMFAANQGSAEPASPPPPEPVSLSTHDDGGSSGSTDL